MFNCLACQTVEQTMIEQTGDAVTLSGAAILAQAYRATLDGIARRRRDGMPVTDLLELARALRRAHDAAMSRPRHELATPSDDPPRWNGQDLSDRLSVADAATFLRLSRRQVQRLAKSPGGLGAVRVGRTWALDRALVLALAEERGRDRGANGVPVQLAP
jgi:excisionase family DNA binding protein